jgi:hypothetical protein
MLWQYRSDTSATGISKAAGALINAYNSAGLPQNTLKKSASPNIQVSSLFVPKTRVNYPVRFSWVNSLSSWYPA